MEALFNEVETGGVDISSAIENAISTAEEMVKTVESEADSLIGKTLAFIEPGFWRATRKPQPSTAVLLEWVTF